jgi:hypothetical protein
MAFVAFRQFGGAGKRALDVLLALENGNDGLETHGIPLPARARFRLTE